MLSVIVFLCGLSYAHNQEKTKLFPCSPGFSDCREASVCWESASKGLLCKQRVPSSSHQLYKKTSSSEAPNGKWGKQIWYRSDFWKSWKMHKSLFFPPKSVEDKPSWYTSGFSLRAAICRAIRACDVAIHHIEKRVLEVQDHQEPTPPGQRETGMTGFFPIWLSSHTKAFMFAASQKSHVKIWHRHGFIWKRKSTGNLKTIEHTTSSMFHSCLLICSVSVRASSPPAFIRVISILKKKEGGVVFRIDFRWHTHRKLDYYPLSQVCGKKYTLMLL